MLFQKCIGPDMFSWIRHDVAEVCAPPSILLVGIVFCIFGVFSFFVWQLGCRVAIILLGHGLCCVPTPVKWYSFCQPQKDERLSQPNLVLIQQSTGLKLRTRRSQASHPNRYANTWFTEKVVRVRKKIIMARDPK